MSKAPRRCPGCKSSMVRLYVRPDRVATMQPWGYECAECGLVKPDRPRNAELISLCRAALVGMPGVERPHPQPCGIRGGTCLEPHLLPFPVGFAGPEGTTIYADWDLHVRRYVRILVVVPRLGTDSLRVDCSQALAP